MRGIERGTLLLLSLALCALLTGCAPSGEPEHQAYAITLSVDRQADGLTLGVQIPSITGSTGGEEGGGGADSYAVFTATASGFSEALDLLRATIPCPLRMSHLKSIVVSEEVARDARFPGLTDEILLTHHLYGAADVLVTAGRADEFLKAQKPVIGTRLSSAVTAELDHYHRNGYIVETPLFELYARNHSVYSDPVLTLTATAQSGGGEPLPADSFGRGYAGKLPREGDNKNEYMGSALMRRGVMAGRLDGLQTRMLLLARGEANHVNYLCRDKSVRLTLSAPPALRTDVSSEPMEIGLSLRFTARPLTDMPPLDALEESLRQDVRALFDACMRAGVEPMGYAEAAASSFPSVEALADYDFSARFSRARLSLSVEVRAAAP